MTSTVEPGGGPLILCCCDCRLTVFSFRTCLAPLVPTSVTFTNGGTTITEAANAAGQVVVQFPNDGDWSYTINVPDPTGYGALTGTVHVTCGALNGKTIDPGCGFPRALTYHGTVGQSNAAFYFGNVTAAQPEPTPYTLTWQSRPADIPLDLQLLYYSYPGGVHDPYYITMPDEAWFSAPIPGFIFGQPTTIYFYAWKQASCNLNVMVIDCPYGSTAYGGGPRGAGNGIQQYFLTSCQPFQMKQSTLGSAPVLVSGTHGTDDLTGANDGAFTDPRIGL